MKAMIIYLIILSSIFSCSKNEDISDSTNLSEDSLIFESTGHLTKYGEIDEGDCGYVIEISDTLYKPISLPIEFETTNITVKIKYKHIDSIFTCGDINVPPYHQELQVIEIIKIEETNNGESDSSIIEGSATINKFGNESEGDCGFILNYNDTLYKPLNLDEQYKINALDVFVKFQLLDSIFTCGDIPKPPYHRELKKIKILEIVEE